MNESIIDYLNGLLDLIGYFDKRYCLTELKSEGDNVYPVHYLANGDWEKITIDQNNGTTYWRKGDISSSKIQNDLTTDVLYQWTIPYRLVAYKRRGDVGTDNEYTADRLADVLTKQLTLVNGALRNTLKARKVEVTVSQRSTDSAAIYAEEYSPAPAKDIPFKYVVVALDVEVIVEGRRDCMDACPTDNDILHAFDFCNPSVFDRLTVDQKDCLTTELCGAADPATLEINGVEIADIASGATRDQDVHDTAGADVGSNSSGEWVVGDTTVRNNATPTWSTTDVAESIITLAQAKMLDSDGVTEVLANYIPSASGTMFTATACAPVPSLAVSLSDANPSLNDSITITATPTNITPTSYTFITPDTDGHYTLTTQAGNTLVWQVDVTSTWTVTVVATDGSSFACNDADGETAGDADALAFISAHDAQTGLSMGATQQAAISGFVERLKGTGTTNGSDLWTLFTGDGAVLFPLCPVDDSTANAAAYKIDLLDPTNFGTYNNFVGGDITPSGVIGGSTKYFQATVNPDDFAQNDIGAHFYCRSDTASTTQADVGTIVSGFSVYTKYNSSNSIIRINETGFPGFTSTSSVLGLMSYVRTDAADVDWYIDGTLEQTQSSGSEAPDTTEICFHAIGTTATNPSSRSLALYAVTAGMTANEVQDFGEAVEWYQTNVITGGRNV